MRRAWRLAICLAPLTLAACSASPGGATAPTSPSVDLQSKSSQPRTLSATAVFNDAGASMTSDGGGGYTDGVSGVVSQLLSGGQFVLNLSASSRTVNIDLTNPLAGGPSMGTLHEGAKLSADAVGGMAVGATIATRFIVSTSAGQLTFDSTANASTSSVSVTRTSSTTWTVSTSSGDIASLTQPNPNNKHQSIVVGYYHVPFSLTFTTH